MLDRDGYRPSIAIVIANTRNQVFWGKRLREHSWQFPQGGIDPEEAPEEAMYRELWEEVGLFPQHVRILGRTRDWLRYHVPKQWIRREWRGNYRGQKQIWYLLRFVGRDSDINLRMTEKPEFDAWRWHDYQVPLDAVIEFKRDVYKSALQELERFLHRRRGGKQGSGGRHQESGNHPGLRPPLQGGEWGQDAGADFKPARIDQESESRQTALVVTTRQEILVPDSR